MLGITFLEAPRRRFLVWQKCFERLRTVLKVMIGKIEEVARGGGREFLLAFALWFGVINNALVIT